MLLLDEADVFVTQRERHAIARNALVSGKYPDPTSCDADDSKRHELTMVSISEGLGVLQWSDLPDYQPTRGPG